MAGMTYIYLTSPIELIYPIYDLCVSIGPAIYMVTLVTALFQALAAPPSVLSKVAEETWKKAWVTTLVFIVLYLLPALVAAFMGAASAAGETGPFIGDGV